MNVSGGRPFCQGDKVRGLCPGVEFKNPNSCLILLKKEKKSSLPPQQSQKSAFPPSTTKPDIVAPLSLQTRHMASWLFSLGGFSLFLLYLFGLNL